MEKAFGSTETNAQFFYDLLHGDSSGIPDEQIDGALSDPMADAKAFPANTPNSPDNSLQGHEVVAAAFNRITKYYPKITEHFQSLGLDLTAMLGTDGALKPDFVTKVVARVSGKDPAAPKQALAYQSVQLYLAEKHQISTRDAAFAEKLKAFEELPQADRDAELKKFFSDAKNVGKLVRWAFRFTEFSLLPFKDQVEVFKQAGYDEAVVKAELAQLWQGRGLPKLVAQAALLKGLELEEEAKTLEGDAAQKKKHEARMLFRAAVELDNQNPLARRRLSSHLLREGKNEGASFHLAEAVKSEGELRYLIEIVQGLEIGDKRLLGGQPDAWSFVVNNLVAVKRYGDASAVYHEAARLATARGDHAASIAFTEQELRVDEAGKPYTLAFTKEQNGIAYAVYKALTAQGLPSALVDGLGDGEASDRKISPTEVFAYLDGHWKEERVQKAMRSLEFPALPWEQPGAKQPYADAAFENLSFPQKMSAWHRYDAEQLKAKQPVDAAAVEKHLRIASLYEPKLPERHRALGDFLMSRQEYSKALAAYQMADQAAGFSDPAIKVQLGHAFFGTGDFKSSRDMYTVALEKNPKDVSLLKLRLEANQLYLAKLDPAKDADAAKAVQAELGKDGAMLLALDAKAEKEKLAGLEKLLEGLHEGDVDKARTIAAIAGAKPDQVGGISKQDAIAAVEGLAYNYLTLAEQSYADPKDSELVRGELNGLAVECFQVLKRYAEKDSDPEVQRMAKVYEASALFAQGKIDEAAELLKPIRKLPQAGRILKAIENGQARLINASAVEAWELYNKDMENAETDSAKGWASRTSVASVQEKWAKEKAITAAVKEKIKNGEASTISEALKLLSETASGDVKERAQYYLSTACRANGTGPIGDLIAYASTNPPSASDAALILQKAFDIEATRGALESSFAIYSILQAVSPEADIKKRAQAGMDALQGKAGFGRSVEKFFKVHSGQGLALDVGLMFLAAGLGNLAKLRMLMKLEQVGVSGYRAVVIANAVGIGAEATALWGANTVKDAMFTDPSKVFSKEHLLKSYGSTLLMIGGLKGFGKLAEGLGPRAAKSLGLVTEGGATLTKGGKVLVWGIGQAGGLGGMIATSHANQALKLTPKPVGGWKEGLVNDVFGYVQFAIAHKVADSVVKGKMTEVAQKQHSGIAFHEALLVSRGNADALGFTAQKFEIKVGKDGALSANGKPLNAYPEEVQRALEASLKKGKGDAVVDQTVFLESPERKLLVGLFVEASLNRPGFSGGKLTKLLAAKDVAGANAYLKEFQLPLQLNADGELLATPAGEPSPHQQLGIKAPEAKPESSDGKDLPFVPDQEVVLLEDGMTPEPKKLAARKTPASQPPAKEKVGDSPVKPVTSKAPLPPTLRRALLVDAQGKAVELDFNEAGLAFLDGNGSSVTPVPGGKSPHAEIAVTSAGKGEVLFQVRALGSEKLQTVDADGKVQEVTATYRPLRDGERLRVGDKEFTWFGPKNRAAFAVQSKVVTVFNGRVLLEDAAKVQERAEWASEYVQGLEKTFVKRESLFGDAARQFAARVSKDPRLSHGEFRDAFVARCDTVLAALRPIIDRLPENQQSDLAFSFMKQVLEGKLSLGDARLLTASVESGDLVIQHVTPEQGKAYDYAMVPAVKGEPLLQGAGLLEGTQGAATLKFNRTVYDVAKIGGALLQFRQGMPRNGNPPNYYVVNRSEQVLLEIYDLNTQSFRPLDHKQEAVIADGAILRVGDRNYIFHAPERLASELAARNEILAERELLAYKRGEILAIPDAAPEKAREMDRLFKLEQDFRDKMQAAGRDADGNSALQKEISHLAAGNTEFAKAAREALAGKLDAAQYRRAQTELGKKMVAEHRAALEDVESFLGGLAADPALEYRFAELRDEQGNWVENPHARLKDPADLAPKLARRGWTELAPLTDIGGARIVVRSTNDALPIAEAIEKQYKVRDQIGGDGAMELDLIGAEFQDGTEVMHVSYKPDKDHPDRLIIGSSTGYRAMHIVVEVDGQPVEIQIQTEAIYQWGKIQHSLIYKNKDLPKETHDVLNAFCRDVAKYLTDLESGPDGTSRPPMPLVPKHLKPELRAALAADLKKMGELMDRYEEQAKDPSSHKTGIYKRPDSLKPPAAEPDSSSEVKTGADTPKAKAVPDGKGRIPSRRASGQPLGKAVVIPELKPKVPPAPARAGYEIPVLRSSDGTAFRLPAGKNPVTLGTKEGGADIVLKHPSKASAPLHAELLREPDGSYRLRPLAGQEVFVWEPAGWRKLGTAGEGETYLLRAGDRIKLGDWEFRWHIDRPPPLPPKGGPKPPPLPSAKGSGASYSAMTDRAANLGRELTNLVEVSDATLSGEDSSWHSSFANIYTPDPTHVPISTSWKYLSRAEYETARTDGTLKDTPAATYEVRVRGAQRLADVASRLQKAYGGRLERLPSLYEDGSEWLLRNERGEAQLKIVIVAKELKTPSAEEAKAVYADFAKKQLPVLLRWNQEAASQRGVYAHRLLQMIGVEGDGHGGLRFGGRLAAVLARMEGAPTAAERNRAGEELATMLAYLKDAPFLMQEQRLLHAAKNDSEWIDAERYAFKQSGPLRERGVQAFQARNRMREIGARMHALGEELRRNVPNDQQKAGNPVFDEYLAVMVEFRAAIKTAQGFVDFLKQSGVDLERNRPAAQEGKEAPPVEVEDDMILEMKSATGRDLHGADDQPLRDLRRFTDSELESLRTLGLGDLEGLRDPASPKFANSVVTALDQLLRDPPFKGREFEGGVVRLVGALRHWEMFSGQKLSWLNQYLRDFGRSPYGIPLASVPPPVPPPPRLPLSAEEQRSLGVREINPGNLMKVIATIRARSTPLERIGDFMPFLPSEEGRRILAKIMDNYAGLVSDANPKLGSYLEAMFKPGEAYAAALDFKEAPEGQGKLPERRENSQRVAALAPTRLGEPTGAYVEEIPATSLVGKELKGLARPRPSFVSEVPGLTPELEKTFDRGGRVEKWPSGMMLVEAPSGAETRVVRPASPSLVVAYLRWYQRQGFARADAVQAETAWRELQGRARELGVQLVLGEDVAQGKPEGKPLQDFLEENSGQVVFLNRLLQLLPASMLGSGRLNRIHLRAPRQGDAHFGAYDAADGSLYLYSGGFQGSRRNLAALFLHELGHPNAERYHTNAKGDPKIPLKTRTQMQQAHATLAKLRALYAVDWAEGAEARRARQAKDLDEFLSDLQLAYVAAGPALRAHIRGYREGSPERQAWDFVYSELRDRIFGGLEYDFVNLPPPPRPGLKVLPGGKAKAPPVPIQVPDAFLSSETGPQNAVQELRLGGLAAGRDPGVGRYAHNEDRFAVARFTAPDGKQVVRYFAIDGMGGHQGGEFAAVFTQYVLQEAGKNPGLSLEEAIRLADRKMLEHPTFKKMEGDPGAVVVGVEVKPLGPEGYEVRFADVGDAEGMIFTHDFQLQENAYTAKEPRSDRKLPRGQTYIARIDPNAHVVDQALGGHYREGKKALDIAVESHRAKAGSIVVAGSDGLTENFISKDEIGEVLRQSGARTAAEMELALRNEALIRMHILQEFRKQDRFGQAITHDDYVAAYRKVWKQDPPAGTWRYEGMVLHSRGQVVNPAKNPNVDGNKAYFVGKFKLDNVSVVVQVLGQEVGSGKAPPPRPNFLPPPLPPLAAAGLPKAAQGGRP
ncbi:MAG: hypothetical protein U1F66_04930 [bacterium]